MKAGIITFHFVNNFGGVLQAFALQKTIEEQFDAEAEIIDYRNRFICFTDWVRLFPITTNLSEIRSGLGTMRLRKKRLKKFDAFLKEHMMLTKRYNSTASLKADVPDCDKYICGSDQIWNPMLTAGVNGAYYCDFVKDPAKKFSYAASFGSLNLKKRQLREVKKYLLELGEISVREEEAIPYVKRVSGRDAVQTIDPVFLVSEKEWKKAAVLPSDIPENYILLYIMQHDESVYSYARKLKSQTKLPVVEISRYGYKPSFIDRTLIDVGPSEFLGLFQNAQYIVSNSYHGLAFSVIFNKKLCLVPSRRFRGRIDSLLKLLDIEKNTAPHDNDLLISFDDEGLREKILSERKKAIDYLRRNLFDD